MASYIKFETSIPYAIGLRTSEILAPQSDIYKAAKTDCGTDFVGQVNKIANTTQFAAVVSGAGGAGVKGGVVVLATMVASAVMAVVAAVGTTPSTNSTRTQKSIITANSYE